MTNEEQVISFPTTRAIIFSFEMQNGSRKSATLDMVNFGSKTYAELESLALNAMAQAGHTEIKSWTHSLIA